MVCKCAYSTQHSGKDCFEPIQRVKLKEERGFVVVWSENGELVVGCIALRNELLLQIVCVRRKKLEIIGKSGSDV